MRAITEMLALLVAYYATFGIMAVGFALMIAGPHGATVAANIFLVRPFWGILGWFRVGLVAVASATWTGVIAPVGAWMAHEIKEVVKDIRWLVTRERGWLWCW